MEQGDSGKDDSENGEDVSSQTLMGISEISERSPSVTDEASVDFSERSVSVHKYEEEWEQIFCREDPDLGELRRRAVTGNLRASRFRSVCWRALLGIFSNDKSNWLKELRRFRQHYSQMSQEFCVDPWEDNNPEDNPLAQNAGSTWHQHFCDNELKAVIKQDVVRTFPGIDFFRKEIVQNAMLNVLFIYARENPEMCYRQGMHEILAPLLFVLHCDHQALLHTKEQVPVRDSICEMLDPQFLEADAYSIFCAIMDAISCYYKINDSVPTSTGYFPPNLQSPVPTPGATRKENEILVQLETIRENLLVPNDRELAEYLNRLEITLPVFGIRWLRLLFGREFPLQDLLVLWDAIFAEGKDFGLVNYVMVAMLVAIRNQLLGSDYTTCLMHLMRYPGAVDITFIIEHALYLKDHQTYSRPVGTSFPVPTKEQVDVQQQPLPAINAQSGRPSHRQHAARERSHQRKSQVQQSGSSLSDKFKKLSTKPSQWTSGRSYRASPSRGGDGDSGASSGSATPAGAGIVEGFAPNDPALLASELHHARAVMSLCRLKLAQYRGILAQAINPTEHPEAQQALDGINEHSWRIGNTSTQSVMDVKRHYARPLPEWLCGLLNSRIHVSAPPEVEPAYEAGEVRVEASPQVPHSSQTFPPPRRSANPPTQLHLRPASHRSHKKEAVRPFPGRNPSQVPLETFKETVEIPVAQTRGYPLADPLHSLKVANNEWPSEPSFQAASFVEL